MSAMLGSVEQWEMARRRLHALKRKYRFAVFHAADFKHRSGEFDGWSEQKCWDLLMDFGHLVHDTLTEAITVTLPYRTYRDHFLDVRPKKLHQTSQYGFCFEAVLYTCTKRVLEARGNHRLSVIVECGHPNAGDTARIFENRKAEWEALGKGFLRTHRLAKKSEDELLMLADATAYGEARQQRAIKKGDARPHADRPTEVVPRNSVGWTVVEVTPDYLDSVINQFHQDRAAKARDYQERKLAWAAKKAPDKQSS